jgi:regulator of sigma E protease
MSPAKCSIDLACNPGGREGDTVTQIDDQVIRHWGDLVASVYDRPGEQVTVTVQRNSQTIDYAVTLGGRGEGDDRVGVLGVAPAVPESLFADARHEVRYGPIAAIPQAVGATWNAATLTVDVLVKMVVGQASVKNISTPVTRCRSG